MLTPTERQAMIAKIRAIPVAVEAVVLDLQEEQLNTPYRQGGWTVRQVVHHLADSHLNAFIRLKLIVTEERPTLKPYDQEAWAKTFEAVEAPIHSSLAILKGLHDRMSMLLESLPESSFTRSAFHPEIGEVTLDDWLATIARHGENHLQHILTSRSARGW